MTLTLLKLICCCIAAENGMPWSDWRCEVYDERWHAAGTRAEEAMEMFAYAHANGCPCTCGENQNDDEQNQQGEEQQDEPEWEQ